MTLVEQIAEQLGIDETGAKNALGTFAGQIAHLVESGGSLDVPGLGNFVEDDGLLLFNPTPELAEAVNHRFAGLETLRVTREDGELTTIAKDEPDVSLGSELEDSSVSELETAARSIPDSEVLDDVAEADGPDVAEADRPDVDSIDSEPSDVFAAGYDHDTNTDDVDDGEELVSGSDSNDMAAVTSTDALDDAKAEISLDKPLAKKTEMSRAGASRARLFVPLIAVACFVVGLLWFINRGDSPTELAENNGPNTTTSQTGPPTANGSQSGTSGETSEAAAPSESAGEATIDTTPLWRPGQIARNTGAYSIVVSSEETRPEAEAIARSIATRLNQITDVLVSTVNGATRYRVGVGEYSSSTQAAQELNQLSSELPDGSWVLRIQPSM